MAGQASVSIRRAHRLSATDKAHLAHLYAEGARVSDLATRYRVNRTTIRAALDAVGLARPPQRMTEHEVAQAVDLYGQGLSIESVGGVLGRSATTVQKALVGRGVEIRSRQRRKRAAEPAECLLAEG